MQFLKETALIMLWIALIAWAWIAVLSALYFCLWLFAHLHELQMILECST